MATPTCPHGGKAYADLSQSERKNRQYTCGDCGVRFTLSEKEATAESVVVPRHRIPVEVHDFRKKLERLKEGS